MGTGDVYHSTALIEVVKSLTPSNVKAHGKVPETSTKVYGTWPIYPHIAQCISEMCGANSK